MSCWSTPEMTMSTRRLHKLGDSTSDSQVRTHNTWWQPHAAALNFIEDPVFHDGGFSTSIPCTLYNLRPLACRSHWRLHVNSSVLLNSTHKRKPNWPIAVYTPKWPKVTHTACCRNYRQTLSPQSLAGLYSIAPVPEQSTDLQKFKTINIRLNHYMCSSRTFQHTPHGWCNTAPWVSDPDLLLHNHDHCYIIHWF
mgnify:CR=1 FL=1